MQDTATETTTPEYVDITAAAAAMDRSRWDVFRLAERGELRAVKYGRLVLVSRYDVEALGGAL